MKASLKMLWEQGKYQGRNERSSPCPSCGGHSRFRIWLTPFLRGWCRECGYFATDSDALPEDILVNYQTEVQKPLATILPDAHMKYFYEQKAKPIVKMYWHSELGKLYYRVEDAIDHFFLGWCSSHPIAHYMQSYTIPYLDSNGICVYIQHRILGDSKIRYMPETTDMGLPPLWNTEVLSRTEPGPRLTIWMTIGVKKAISLWVHGLQNTMSMYCAEYLLSGGRSKFRVEEAVAMLKPVSIYFLPDPGEEEMVIKSIKRHKLDARVFSLKEKVDDYLRVDPTRIEHVKGLLTGPTPLGQEILLS